MWALYYLNGEDNPFYGQLFGPFKTADEARTYADQKAASEDYDDDPCDIDWADDGMSGDFDGCGCILIQKLKV